VPGGLPLASIPDNVHKLLMSTTHGVETLRKISIAWERCTNITDNRQTDDRQTDRRWYIANVSSHSLIMITIIKIP